MPTASKGWNVKDVVTIIGLLTMIFGGGMSYATLKSDSEHLQSRVVKLEQKIEEINEIKTDLAIVKQAVLMNQKMLERIAGHD